jgi:hypothetical protein
MRLKLLGILALLTLTAVTVTRYFYITSERHAIEQELREIADKYCNALGRSRRENTLNYRWRLKAYANSQNDQIAMTEEMKRYLDEVEVFTFADPQPPDGSIEGRFYHYHLKTHFHKPNTVEVQITN